MLNRPNYPVNSVLNQLFNQYQQKRQLLLCIVLHYESLLLQLTSNKLTWSQLIFFGNSSSFHLSLPQSQAKATRYEANSNEISYSFQMEQNEKNRSREYIFIFSGVFVRCSNTCLFSTSDQTANASIDCLHHFCMFTRTSYLQNQKLVPN